MTKPNRNPIMSANENLSPSDFDSLAEVSDQEASEFTQLVSQEHDFYHAMGMQFFSEILAH